MTNKNALDEGRRLQAEAVAAQEEADKIHPYPSQAQVDAAKLGTLSAELADEDETDGEEKSSSKSTEKSESAEKPASYKTRAAKAD